MRIKQSQLTASLKKQLPAVVVVSGDEPLLIQESCDQIRNLANESGFEERLVYHSAKGFDWAVLDEHSQALSLFGERKLIEIRLETLPDNSGKKRLQEWAEQPPEDNLLLLVSKKIESATLNTKWFKAIEAHCLHVQIWPVGLQQLPQWINQRLHIAGFQPTSSAVTALSDHVEGNLLAAQQEIEKLRLLNTDEQLDESDVLASIADSNRYNVFNLSDACLSQDVKHVIKIMQTLEAESMEPSIVLWSISKEIRLLAKLYGARVNGLGIESQLQKERVFKSKWSVYQNYLRRISPGILPQAHGYCQRADKAIKGLEQVSPWRLLTQAALIIAGVNGLGALSS